MSKKLRYKAGHQPAWTVLFVFSSFALLALFALSLYFGLLIGGQMQRIEMGKYGIEVTAILDKVVPVWSKTHDDFKYSTVEGYDLEYSYSDNNGKEYRGRRRKEIYETKAEAEAEVGNEIIITIYEAKGWHEPNRLETIRQAKMDWVIIRFSIFFVLFVGLLAVYICHGLYKPAMRKKALGTIGKIIKRSFFSRLN